MGAEESGREDHTCHARIDEARMSCSSDTDGVLDRQRGWASDAFGTTSLLRPTVGGYNPHPGYRSVGESRPLFRAHVPAWHVMAGAQKAQRFKARDCGGSGCTQVRSKEERCDERFSMVLVGVFTSGRLRSSFPRPSATERDYRGLYALCVAQPEYIVRAR